jgi:protein disulfide-isomerase A6
MRFSFTLFATALLVVGVSASNVLDLTPDNWDDVVGKGRAGLVELYVHSL